MGLFDAKTPNEVQQDIRKENIALDSTRGALTGWQAIGAAAYGGGRGLGQALSGPDPRIDEAQKMQQAQEIMMQSGLTPDNPEFFMESARVLQGMGLNRPAMKALAQGKELEMSLQDRDLDRENIRSQIDARSFVNKGLRSGKVIKVENADGTVSIHDRTTGAHVADVTRDGKPVTTLESVKEKRISENQEESLKLRRKREETRAGNLRQRKKAHVDKLYGEFADDYRTDTEPLKKMSQEIEGALTILNKKDFTGSDAKYLQRFLATIRKSGSKAQAEIVAWEPGEFGDLIQRIEGSLSGFFTGEYSDTEIALAKDTLEFMLDNHVEPAFQRYDNFYSVKANRRGLKADEIVRPRPGNKENLPTPQSQSDFDSLPSGSVYIDPDDGKKYRKP